MPDLRGLNEADALQALVDAGIDGSIVQVSERPAAGESGRVVQQTPVFGVLNPTLVSLVISTAAEVPEAAGRPAAEVISALQQLGSRVVQERVYEPGATVGNVVRTEPAAGEALSDAVTVFIADTPTRRSLRDLDTIGRSPSWQQDTLFGGVSVDNLAEFGADRTTNLSSVTDYSWKLEGMVSTIEGSFALAEQSDPEFDGVFVVYADGVEIARHPAATTPQSFSWDVRGASTLVIHALRSTQDKSGSLVLIDAEALGSFDQMATIR